MTTKERNKHYKNAYETIQEGTYNQLCTNISLSIYGTAYNFDLITANKFPELFLFEPDYHDDYEWFDFRDKETRLNILSFCIAMTEK